MKGRFRLGDIRARMPMRVRLGVFALLFALPVLLLAFLQMQRDNQRIHRAAIAAVNEAAQAKVRRLTQDLKSAEAVARSLGAVDLTRPGAAAACSLALKRAVEAAGPRITNYIIAAPNGQVLCSGLPIPPGANVADRPYVQQALRTKLPALSGFLVGRVSGIEGLQLAVPIVDASDRVTAVAFAGLAAASMVGGMRADDELPLTFAVFDLAGVLVARDPGVRAVPLGMPAATSELFGRREALSLETAELRDLDGVPRRYASRPVRMGGDIVMWVMSAVDVRAVNAATLASGSRDLGMVLLLAIVVAGIAFVGTRTLVLQRYRGLFSVVAEVAVGNYSSRVPVIVQDEVGAVETAFNSMLAAVETDRSALEQANRALIHESAGRRASEDALKAREHELRDAKRLAGLGSWFLDPDGSVHWSEECAVIFGRDPALRAPASNDGPRLLAPDSYVAMQDGLRRILASGQPYELELEVIRPDQTQCWIIARGEAVRAADGSVTGARGTALDITERKRAEMALRESEAEFRALAESMPQIVWMIHPDGRTIYFNQRWSDYTGMTLADSSGYGWKQPFHPDDGARAWKAWQLVAATGGTFMTESRLRRADGDYRWWLLRGEAQRDANGAIAKWVGTCTDIDDLKLAELEISRANRDLEQQQNEWRVLFDLMPARIIFKDTENRILRINRHGASIVGRPIEEIEGRLATEIYPAYVGLAADLEVIRTGQPQLGTVHMLRDQDGLETWVQRDRVPYRDASGKVAGIVLMTQDVTARKRDQDSLRELNTDLESRVRRRTGELNLARAEAERASRAKSDFLAAMSHEIRTPMSGLLGLLELLQLSGLDEEQHSTLGLARDSGGTLLSMIDDILDFSKIEANRLDLNLVAGSVKAIVENACRLHSQVASSKNLILQLDVAPEIGPALAVDPLRLGQILNNFLNNAIKFTERGSVRVAVELVGRRDEFEQLRFTVQDTGIGMTPEQLGLLFEPFAQADAATTARFGGTGLGLVIARRLAELMGGSVEIDSEAGVGTTLTLRLSLEICDAAGLAQPALRSRLDMIDAVVAGRRRAPSVEAAQGEGTLVLVVDDHPTNRLVLLRQLASLGYAGEAAADGVEALAMWRSGRFAAVITDCNMPRMNGYELAGEIRDRERRNGLRRVPIIACTANAQQSATDLCLGAGMDDCMVKPADLARVSETLDRWIPLERNTGPGQLPAAGDVARVDVAAGSTEGLLDTSLLAEISGGDAALQGQLLDGFQRANELDAAALRRAAAHNDCAAVLEFAHRIKGASLMVGATRLSEVCKRLESAGAAGEQASVRVAMGSFETELDRLNHHLEGLV